MPLSQDILDRLGVARVNFGAATGDWITTHGAMVLPVVTRGMIEASAIRRLSRTVPRKTWCSWVTSTTWRRSRSGPSCATGAPRELQPGRRTQTVGHRQERRLLRTKSCREAAEERRRDGAVESSRKLEP